MTSQAVIHRRGPVKALTDRIATLKARGLLGIVKAICSRDGASVEEIFSEGRSAHIVRARRMVWWELHDRGWNYVEIGRFFGRNHSSIIKGVATAAQELGVHAPVSRARRAA